MNALTSSKIFYRVKNRKVLGILLAINREKYTKIPKRYLEDIIKDLYMNLGNVRVIQPLQGKTNKGLI